MASIVLGNQSSFDGSTLGVQLLRKGYFGGDLLCSSSDVFPENVSFIDSDSVNLQNSPIMQQGEYQRNILVKSRVSVKYLSGNCAHSIFIFLVAYCVFCSSNSYSLSAGHLNPKNQSLEQTHQKCFPCPLGGICEKGITWASSNIWGFTTGTQVHFAACPLDTAA